jgi:hypothetical protein
MIRTYRGLATLGMTAAAVGVLVTSSAAAPLSRGPSCRVLPASAVPVRAIVAAYRGLTRLPPRIHLTTTGPRRYGRCGGTYYAIVEVAVAPGQRLTRREQIDQMDHGDYWRRRAGSPWHNEGLRPACSLAPPSLINQWRTTVKCRDRGAASPLATERPGPDPAARVLITRRDLPGFFPGGYLTFSEELATCLRRVHLGRGWVVPPDEQDALYRGGLIVTAGEQSVFSQARFAASTGAARRAFSTLSDRGFSRCLTRALETSHTSVGVIPRFAAATLAAPRFGQRSSTRRFIGTLYNTAAGDVGNAIADDLGVIQRGRLVGVIGLESIVAGPLGQLHPFPADLRLRLARLMAKRMARA